MIFLIYLIICFVIMVRYSIRCMGIIRCYNKKCKFRHFCSRYKESITEEEAKELMELIDTYKS